jgi:hypothetical protein
MLPKTVKLAAPHIITSALARTIGSAKLEMTIPSVRKIDSSKHELESLDVPFRLAIIVGIGAKM